MTSQKLYEILKSLDELDKKLGLQAKLEAVSTALTNLVSQPAQPQFQSALASALTALDQAAERLAESIAPSQDTVIDAMGGGEFFDPAIAEKVKASVQMNAMTPSVASEYVQQLTKLRGEFLSTVRNARLSLEKLGITGTKLEPGSADLAFLIPRTIFGNELGQFSKELNFINRLLQHFSEALTGKVEQIELEQLSSSVPTIALAASVPVIGVVALIVNKFLEAWEKIEKIRKIRAEIAEMGMGGAAQDELTERIETTVDEVVEESTQLVLAKYEGGPGRRNELATAISQDTRRLFGQIERGLTVEFRAAPVKDADPEDVDQKALTNIRNLARVMQFPETKEKPVLLQGAEILEGEIHAVKHSKKTTTTKTSTSKKPAQKETATTDQKE